MLAITFPVNLIMFGGAVFIAFLLGFLARSGQMKKLRKKVAELEHEMVSNHADILDLQKEKAQLELALKSTSDIPVIPMNSGKEEKKVIVEQPRKQVNGASTPVQKHS